MGSDDPVGVFVLCCIVTVSVVTLIWAVGLVLGNHSVMDGYYGFGYAVPVWIAFWVADAQSPIAALLLLMASLHGCRLGYYLLARWRRYVPVHGGDPRYLQHVRTYSPGYWWKSFFVVMEPQAVLIILVGSPAVAGILINRHEADSNAVGLVTMLGVAIFAVGLYFETLGDGQLQAFLADPKRTTRYLNTGVWTHSRHPHYFGNICVWWGIWLVAVSGNPDAWWTVIGPLANTFMLTRVLGVAFQDKYMGDRPEYVALMKRTRALLPLPLRHGAKDTQTDTVSQAVADGAGRTHEASNSG